MRWQMKRGIRLLTGGTDKDGDGRRKNGTDSGGWD